MLPLPQRVAFLLFACITLALAARAFHRLALRIRRGRPDTDLRLNHLPRRLRYALLTTLTQSRTFRTRPLVGLAHSFIFYGFTFYLLVNLVDALEGFFVWHPQTESAFAPALNLYTFTADILSLLVLLGVLALLARRFLLPSRRDFTFNPRTLLHPALQLGKVTRDSLIVSAFILLHVGSRALGSAAKLSLHPDPCAPCATLLAHAIPASHALAFEILGYWGALGSVLAFLAYFPYSKHLHIFATPAKYLVAREVPTGVLPHLDLNLDADPPQLGAERLEDLAWPRILDAYACIQCNRCQDVCPATATGKSLSPSALEINKRMELNQLGQAFEAGAPSPAPLLQFALTPEAAWACTTCGACLDICPVQDEPMLDILDIRRHQVLVAGDFPSQLQPAFRGMERNRNPWGLSPEKRLDWTEGLHVPTTDQNPTPDVLFWVGCAAAYDPQSQKTARAFVQLLTFARVDFAVLGKRECCTGDPARRAGNEALYQDLATQNITTLDQIRPKLVVATCPHCLNAVGKEYKQLGGDYKVIHHTEYLAQLVAEGRLTAQSSTATVAFHDPCYLGRHNGVYDAPRNLLNILSNSPVELPRNRQNSFCCGAGGAQFWKEEEPGTERIAENRLREAHQTLAPAEDKVLAVGCPFCKSMLQSTPGNEPLEIRDIAELLLEGVQKHLGITTNPGAPGLASETWAEPPHPPAETQPQLRALAIEPHAMEVFPPPQPTPVTIPQPTPELTPTQPAPVRKAWKPKAPATPEASATPPTPEPTSQTEPEPPAPEPATPRKAWKPKPKP